MTIKGEVATIDLEWLQQMNNIMFFTVNKHFGYLDNYLKEKTFGRSMMHLSERVPVVRFKTTPLSEEFIEGVIRPWVLAWNKQYRDDDKKCCPVIKVRADVVEIKVRLTAKECAAKERARL